MAMDTFQSIYLYTAPALLLFTSVGYPLMTKAGLLPASLEFLPLMMTSVWCSLGLWLAWGRLVGGLWRSLFGNHIDLKLE